MDREHYVLYMKEKDYDSYEAIILEEKAVLRKPGLFGRLFS